jgi:hypothetical protein
MAELFPKPFPNANLSRAIVSPAIQKARRVIAFVPYPILFSSFFGAAGDGAMDIISHPTATLFRQFAGSCTRRLQPHQAVEPTVPELGMLILGAAVYITHISKENDHRAIRHLHGGNNCEVAASPANAKFG